MPPVRYILPGRSRPCFREVAMLNFEEELKKFKPSLEIEDAEEIIYNQDIDDMSDVLIKVLKGAKDDTESAKRSK